MPLHPYRHYLKLHWRLITLGLLSLVITNALDAVAPWFLGQAIDQITTSKPQLDVLKTVLTLLAISTGLALARFLWRYFWMQFHHSVADDLRQRLFAKLMAMGPSFYQGRTTGDLMSLINNDVNVFRMAIGPGILILADSLLLMIFIPTLMWKISPDWTLKCMVLLPLVPFVARMILKKTKAAYDAKQTAYATMSGFAQELVSGLRIIKSHAQEDNQTELFKIPSDHFQKASNKAETIDATFGPVLELFAALGAVILLFIGAGSLVSGAVSVGSFFAFFQYIQRMVWPLEALGIAFAHFQNGHSAYKRILELLTYPTDLPQGGSEPINEFNSLEIRNLSFSYPDSPDEVLHDLSFRIKQGQIVGLVGLTGAGKTSLIDILGQLYPTPRGTLWLNGKPLENYEKSSLRKLFSFASQEPFLFAQSIKSNILLGSQQLRWDDVRWATELVKLDQELLKFSDHENSLLGENGVNLSGGQRQRVALARALVRRSPLMIIDDSLSAVDAKTEAQILDRLKNELQGRRSALIVSHRLAALQWADHIVVLNKGHVEAQGTSEELKNTSPTYRRLLDLQQGERA